MAYQFLLSISACDAPKKKKKNPSDPSTLVSPSLSTY